MTVNDMTIRIGGAAGDGVESSGAGFCKALTRAGLYVYGLPDYYSRIRGGHNFYSVRIADRPLYTHDEPVHLLLALTAETLPRHREALVPGAVAVYDSALDVPPEGLEIDGVTVVPLPMSEIAQEAADTTLARNTVALGFAAGITGLPFEPLQTVIRDNFARKGQAVVDGNLRAMLAGYERGQAHASEYAFKLQAQPDAPPRMVLNGTAAFAMGCLAGGCRFVCGYPMTPGSLALHWMAAHAQEYGVTIKHTEDEIAAINMAVGAAHIGARALVPTSGGGFSLMVEGLGLAGMTETPVVIYNAQRPGPATGLPTRHEQADLLFMLHASQGEFPRFLLSPGTHEQAFEAGWRAFNIADQFQTPVLVLSDHHLAVAQRTVDLDAFDFEAIAIERGALLSEAELDALDEPYRRFQITPSGVSPRAIPGHPNAVYTATSNEHDEYGAITEEPQTRTVQVNKRARKLTGMAAEINAPKLYGPAEADVTYICWGSTFGPLCEAVHRLNISSGAATGNVLHFSELWPFPAKAVHNALDRARRTVVVEVNSTAQLASLIQANTGRSVDGVLLRYDGHAFTPQSILDELSV
jgi:2-oxoglutarate ferredoxin oxidoreductase subunit alpha